MEHSHAIPLNCPHTWATDIAQEWWNVTQLHSEKLGPRDCHSWLCVDLWFNFCFALEAPEKRPSAPVLKAYFNKVLGQRFLSFLPSLLLFGRKVSMENK